MPTPTTDSSQAARQMIDLMPLPLDEWISGINSRSWPWDSDHPLFARFWPNIGNNRRPAWSTLGDPSRIPQAAAAAVEALDDLHYLTASIPDLTEAVNQAFGAILQDFADEHFRFGTSGVDYTASDYIDFQHLGVPILIKELIPRINARRMAYRDAAIRAAAQGTPPPPPPPPPKRRLRLRFSRTYWPIWYSFTLDERITLARASIAKFFGW